MPFALFFFVFVLLSIPSSAQIPPSNFEEWPQTKGPHFVVLVQDKTDQSLGPDILRAAEDDYDKIARQIGYSRYGNFWTWDERVKIVIFSDQLSFAMTTDQPVWSKGFAVRDTRLLSSRMIVSFKQEEGFLDKVLPHEISHLILRDFIGFDRTIPLWFDEGVAQLNEKLDEGIQNGMVFVAQNHQTVPFEIMQGLDIRQEKDAHKVAIFYAQCRFVLEFLIRNYGQDAFHRLCREMKAGETFDKAFKSAYAPSLDSFKALESKWLADLLAVQPASN